MLPFIFFIYIFTLNSFVYAKELPLRLAKSPSPPPGTEKWRYIPNNNRIIKTFSYIDQCGGEGKTMLSYNQDKIFTLTSLENNSDLILHTLNSDNGKEIWNISINKRIKGTIFVSSSKQFLVYGHSLGNNTFYINCLELTNGMMLWNKTLKGNGNYNFDNINLFRLAINDNNSNLIINPTDNTNYLGSPIFNYDLSTGNSINMVFLKTYPNRVIFFTTDLKSLFYRIGDGSESDISGNWISNGTIRKLNISNSLIGCNLGGVDNYFITIECSNHCQVNCPCYTYTSIYSLKTGQVLGGSQNCDWDNENSGINWIKYLGYGHLLYKKFSGNPTLYTINYVSINSNNNWNIPTDYLDNSFIPNLLLPSKNLILITSLSNDISSTISKITARWINNGTIAWSNTFSWTILKKSGYESDFNQGSCGSNIYSLKDNNTLIVIDSHYNGHAILLNNGSELFNISTMVTSNSYPYSYPPSNTLSFVSKDANTIYSVLSFNKINNINGYVKATYIGNNCDSNHYGIYCNNTCNCKHKHSNKTCDSGMFGTGECFGKCKTNWTGYSCDDCENTLYGKNCSNKMTCYTGIKNTNPQRNIGGICDCGINGTGYCSSCYPRYQGKNCDDCSDEYYGDYCSNTCTCKYGVNSSGLNGTGYCKYCNDKKWSGKNCDICNKIPDVPQCNTKYKPIDCLDPINGEFIKKACPSMCNSCPSTTQKYKCINNQCVKNLNGGTLNECNKICSTGYWHCINGHCVLNLNNGLNKSECKNICY